ncbi:cation diffusion facilitator family transporter [Flammeovirga agarivorans]|uniref:Cation transporter n=1 Tax=Flammeovirga agarivorans TaxID=2726742 RepID=A0A7X8SGT0_9BACT|nr:cation diffusion facilitator family transporter [Flammeovirga agarivorans]NLR89985.1 cation transporter [Flammeovirga agarivorans]
MEKKIDKKKETLKASMFSIIGNTLLAGIKGTAGVLGHSYALIADAIESTTDIVSSIIVLFGVQYAQKSPDVKHPYGYGKIEPVMTIFIGLLLVFSGCFIGYNSIENIVSPEVMVPEKWTLFVIGPIILWKELSFQWVMRKAKKTQSTSLKADAWHHRADAVTSLTAFIGISISLYFGESFHHADSYAALFAAAFILWNSYRLIKPAVDELLDKQIYNSVIDHIGQIAKRNKQIDNMEKCLVRKSGMFYSIDLHIRVNPRFTVKKGHEIAHELKHEIMSEIPNIIDVLIHVEPTY